jgi:hypothetical protein
MSLRVTWSVLHAVFDVSGWELFVRLVTITFIGTALVNLLPASIYPRRSTRGGWIAAIAVIAAIATLGWAVGVFVSMRALAHPHADKLLPASEASITGSGGGPRSSPGTYLGGYEPREVASYQQVSDFTSQIGRDPNMVLYYSTITTPQAVQLGYTHTSRSTGRRARFLAHGHWRYRMVAVRLIARIAWRYAIAHGPCCRRWH